MVFFSSVGPNVHCAVDLEILEKSLFGVAPNGKGNSQDTKSLFCQS